MDYEALEYQICEIIGDWYLNWKHSLVNFDNRTHSLGLAKEELKILICTHLAKLQEAKDKDYELLYIKPKSKFKFEIGQKVFGINKRDFSFFYLPIAGRVTSGGVNLYEFKDPVNCHIPEIILFPTQFEVLEYITFGLNELTKEDELYD